jgi:nitrite reductase/ring-hydroxylating ferredoxin subunit
VSAVRAPVRHAVGHVDDFTLDEFRVFDLGGRPVGVVRTPDGFRAVRNRCPHQGADICAGRVTGTWRSHGPQHYEYDGTARIVICPWHRWEFDLQDGTSVARVTNKRLVTYAVEVDGADVYVLMKGRAAP